MYVFPFNGAMIWHKHFEITESRGTCEQLDNIKYVYVLEAKRFKTAKTTG